MLRATFGIDPKLSKEFYIEFTSHGGEYLMILFDSGELHSISPYRMHKLLIPDNATKIYIESDDNITHYGRNVFNRAIISIEEFISDSIINCHSMFYGFTNLKEVKNVNLNWNKIEIALGMCANWKSFNGILPENFCSDMSSLTDARAMFFEWNSFNQQLPNNFCSNMVSLVNVEYMFNGWNSFNQKLPDTFFPDKSYMTYSDFMFFGWWLCDDTPKYKLPNYMYNYKKKDIDELNKLLKNDEVIDYQLLSILNNKKYLICLKGNVDHYVLIDAGKIKCLYEYHKIFTYKPINEAIVIS